MNGSRAPSYEGARMYEVGEDRQACRRYLVFHRNVLSADLVRPASPIDFFSGGRPIEPEFT